MLIREITDPQTLALNNQLADLRKRKKLITADKARERARKAMERAKRSRQLAAQAQQRAAQAE